MNRRTFLASVSSSLTAAAADPAVDVEELLRRVGGEYERISAGPYDVTVTLSSLSDSVQTWVRSFSHCRLIAAEGKHRLEGRESTYLSDGQTVWVWDGRIREYTEDPVATEEGQRRQKILLDFHERHVGRFRLLPKLQAEKQFLGFKELKAGGQKIRCAVLKIKLLPAGSEPWQEQLWIDPQTALVRKSLMERQARTVRGIMKLGATLTAVWDRIAAVQPIHPALLVFQPQGFRRVHRLSRTGHVPEPFSNYPPLSPPR